MTVHKGDLSLETKFAEYARDPHAVAERLSVKLAEQALALLALNCRSQRWLAEAMGVSQSAVSRILNSSPNLTMLTVAKLAAALEVDPEITLDVEAFPIECAHERSKDMEDRITDEALQRTFLTANNGSDVLRGTANATF